MWIRYSNSIRTDFITHSAFVDNVFFLLFFPRFFFLVFHQCFKIITSMDVHWICTNLYMYKQVFVCFFSFFAMFPCWTYFVRLAASSQVMKHLQRILMWNPPPPQPPPPLKCSCQQYTFLFHSPFYLMLIDTLFLISAIFTGMQK